MCNVTGSPLKPPALMLHRISTLVRAYSAWNTFTYLEGFLEIRVLNTCRAKAKSHLSSQRRRIPSQMVNKIVGILQHSKQHCLILKILVRHIGPRSLKFQNAMRELPTKFPGLIGLLCALQPSASRPYLERSGIWQRTIHRILRPPLIRC